MKNLKFQLLAILIAVLFTSCDNLFNDGLAEGTAYETTISYENRQGIIIIQVEVGGKLYDFMLDSGAVTLFSKNVASGLNMTIEKSGTFTDSQENEFTIDFGHAESIRIGDINYKDITAGITDMSTLNSISCLNIDGIIGSNLMRNSIWEIDYNTQTIKIADRLASFDIPANNSKIKFKTNDKGEAFIKLEVEGIKEKKVEIDLGSTGAFKLSPKLLEKISAATATQAEGFAAAGLGGYGNDILITTFVKSDKLTIDGMPTGSQMIAFNAYDETSTMGNEFLKNFRVVIDWLDKDLYLIGDTNTASTTTSNYGFDPIFKDGKPLVGLVYNMPNSGVNDLAPTDEILSINGQDCRNISKEEWCQISNDLEQGTNSTIEIIVNRAGNTITKTLHWNSIL